MQQQYTQNALLSLPRNSGYANQPQGKPIHTLAIFSNKNLYFFIKADLEYMFADCNVVLFVVLFLFSQILKMVLYFAPQRLLHAAITSLNSLHRLFFPTERQCVLCEARTV